MVVFQVMLELCIVLIIGYVLAKIDVLNADTGRRISSLVVNVTMPMLIISAVAENMEKGTLAGVLGVFGLGVACYVVMLGVSWVLTRLMRTPQNERGTYQFMLIFSNCSFMGYPVLDAIFGSEAVFLSAIFNIPFNLIAFSYGIMLISKDGQRAAKFDPRKLINLGILSSVLALIIFAIGRPLPALVTETCTMVGDTTTPLSMIVLGVSLAQIPVKSVFTDLRVYVMTFFRLILLPLLVYAACRNFVADQMVLGVAVMTFAMPVASMTVMLSNQYEGNVKLASVGVFISTILSVITIPILSVLLFG